MIQKIILALSILHRIAVIAHNVHTTYKQKHPTLPNNSPKVRTRSKSKRKTKG